MSASTWDEGPLSLSVVKNVWAQPSINDDASASNSLRDLVDDFPSTLPSMNDLKAEEEQHLADGASESMGQADMFSHPIQTLSSQTPAIFPHPTSSFDEQYSSPSASMSMAAPFQPSSSPYVRDNPSPWQRPMHQYSSNTAYQPQPQPYPSYAPNMAGPDFSNGIWLPQQPARKQPAFGAYASLDSSSYVSAGLPGAQIHSARSSSRNFTRGRSSHDTPFGNNAFTSNLQMGRGGPNAYLNPSSISQASPYGRF